MSISINNPINSGLYADPEARIYEGEYWIYATRSRPFALQHNIDAFHSKDGKSWEKCEGVIDMGGFPQENKAVWAPTIIQKNNKYYMIFAINDIHTDEEPGGLEIAVSDSPAGPFKAYTKGDFVGKIINGAQPIDAHLFKDDDGKIYLFYGGWHHCNVAVMNDDMTGFIPFEDNEVFREITPEKYVEGPCMFKKDGRYYFMWSTGSWSGDSYGVCYAVSDSPLGPFKMEKQILKSDESVAKGPGHNGYFHDGEDWYIVYHRRPLCENNGNFRQLCIDKMTFKDGKIEDIRMK